MTEVQESKGKDNHMQIVLCSKFRRTLDRLKRTGAVSKDLAFYFEANLNQNTGPQIISKSPKTLPDYERTLLITSAIKRFSKTEYQAFLRDLFQDDEIFVEGAEDI